VTRVLGPNQLIRVWAGREHTEVRALDPGRSSFSCLSPLSLIYSLYNTITGRRKEEGRNRLMASTYGEMKADRR
jgi:hypothetical protein